MTDYWSTRDGVETAAALRRIPQELKRIRDLLEEEFKGRGARPNTFSTDPLARTALDAPLASSMAEDPLFAALSTPFAKQTFQESEAMTTAGLRAQMAALNKVQHIAPIMQFGEMHTIYDTSDNPQRQGKRLGIVTRGVDGWLIEEAMIRMGPHGDDRRMITENRRALHNALENEVPIQRLARPEPHEKHENAIKMYFQLLGPHQEELTAFFLGYLAADVADFIMHTPFGHQHTWSDGAKLDVLSYQSKGKTGLRANMLVMDAHKRDEARAWVAEMELALFEDYVEEE